MNKKDEYDASIREMYYYNFQKVVERGKKQQREMKLSCVN